MSAWSFSTPIAATRTPTRRTSGSSTSPTTPSRGRRVADVLPGLYEEQIRPQLDRAFAGEHVAYQLQQARAGGTSYYSVHYTPALVDGDVRAVTGVITDITDVKSATIAASRLAAIVASSNDAVIGKDLDGIVTTWNAGAERIFGYTAAEMIGTSIRRLVPEERQAEEDQILERVRRGDRTEHLETIRVTKDGRRLHVSITTSPIKDESGRVIGASKVARDITGRRRIESALREREEQLRLYAEHSPVAIAMLDREMRYIVASRRWIEDFRLADHPIIGRSHYDVFPEIPMRWIDIHRRCLAGAIEKCDEDAFVRADGTVWLRWEIRPWHGSDGAVGGIIIFAEDITAGRRAEAERRASEARYRTLFDYAPDGILVSDRDGRYVDANPSICAMLGCGREDLVGRRAADILAAAAEGAGERGLPWLRDAQECRLRRQDGSAITAELIATTMPDGAVVEMVRDVTERNRATEALRAAEERMRFALESASVGIWDMDYTAGVLRWSATLEAHFGLAAGTFPGTFDAFLDRVHPEDRGSLMAGFEQSIRTGKDFSTAHRAVWPDGSVHWLTGAGRIHTDADGKPVRGIGISLDQTAQHALEQQYQQAQKMEAIGRLAGGVAHDFNNLLTAILGYCDLAAESLHEGDPLLGDIGEIRRAGVTAAALTRQLLAFSRKQIVEPTLLDVNTIVGDLRGMLSRLIGEDVIVVVRLSARPALVTADRGQLEQVLLNLCVNARDAMPKGGSLTIEIDQVQLDEDYTSSHFDVTAGSYVALTITDTGMGMPPDVQAHLFEPFFTTKPQGKGTGLGLATVHGIVKGWGGRVTVYSELGRGTSFTVYVPSAAAGAVADALPATRDPARVSPQTVLVVEDSDGLRQLTRRFLQRQGHTVLVAENADEARQVFEAHPAIGLVLTDVVMPGASGPDLIRDLAARRPDLKVIYMSGYTEDAIVHHGVLRSDVAFLHKPFTADALARKIAEVVGTDRP